MSFKLILFITNNIYNRLNYISFQIKKNHKSNVQKEKSSELTHLGKSKYLQLN